MRLQRRAEKEFFRVTQDMVQQSFLTSDKVRNEGERIPVPLQELLRAILQAIVGMSCLSVSLL